MNRRRRAGIRPAPAPAPMRRSTRSGGISPGGGDAVMSPQRFAAAARIDTTICPSTDRAPEPGPPLPAAPIAAAASSGAVAGPGPRRSHWSIRLQRRLPGLLLALLAGCQGPVGRPLPGLERQLDQLGAGRDPALGDGRLALISGRGGREQVLLIDLRRAEPIPLPGLNRPDARPLAVAIDQRGDRLVVVRQWQGRTEVVLYRRAWASTELVPMQPAGVPRRVALDPQGRILAVELSRNGLWQLDLIPLPP